MPQLKAARVERLTLPSSTPDDEAWVEIRTRVTSGDVQAAQSAMMKVTLADFAVLNTNGQANPFQASASAKLSEVEIFAVQNTLLERLIVDWNFTDEAGEKLEINRKTIDLLDANDVEHIWVRVQKLLPGRSQAQEANFEKPSPSSSPAGAMDQ